MIAADRQLILSQLKQSAVQLREKELRFYTDNYQALGTTSALLAGFAFTALSNQIPDGAPFGLSLLFHVATIGAMVWSLFCVCNCTTVSMFGPGLALRGPSGSMKEAVEAMKQFQQGTYFFFKVGILFIHFSAAALVWCYRYSGESARDFGWVTATIITVALVVSCVYMYFLIGKVHGTFRYGEQQTKMQLGSILQTESGDFFDPSDASSSKIRQNIDNVIRYGIQNPSDNMPKVEDASTTTPRPADSEESPTYLCPSFRSMHAASWKPRREAAHTFAGYRVATPLASEDSGCAIPPPPSRPEEEESSDSSEAAKADQHVREMEHTVQVLQAALMQNQKYINDHSLRSHERNEQVSTSQPPTVHKEGFLVDSESSDDGRVSSIVIERDNNDGEELKTGDSHLVDTPGRGVQLSRREDRS